VRGERVEKVRRWRSQNLTVCEIIKIMVCGKQTNLEIEVRSVRWNYEYEYNEVLVSGDARRRSLDGSWKFESEVGIIIYEYWVNLKFVVFWVTWDKQIPYCMLWTVNRPVVDSSPISLHAIRHVPRVSDPPVISSFSYYFLPTSFFCFKSLSTFKNSQMPINKPKTRIFNFSIWYIFNS